MAICKHGVKKHQKPYGVAYSLFCKCCFIIWAKDNSGYCDHCKPQKTSMNCKHGRYIVEDVRGGCICCKTVFINPSGYCNKCEPPKMKTVSQNICSHGRIKGRHDSRLNIWSYCKCCDGVIDSPKLNNYCSVCKVPNRKEARFKIWEIDSTSRMGYADIDLKLKNAGFDFTKPIDRTTDTVNNEYVYFQNEVPPPVILICYHCKKEFKKSEKLIKDIFAEEDVHFECYEEFLLNINL